MGLQTYILNKKQQDTNTPHVVVQWLTFLLRIREVPGSNLGPETGYHD
jgi:hypothetical protein